MRRRFIDHGRWYFTLSVLSVGFLAWVPFVHASSRVTDAAPRSRAWAYGALAVVLLVIAGVTPTDAQGEPVGTTGSVLSTLTAILAIGIVVGACVQLGPVRRKVYGTPPPTGPGFVPTGSPSPRMAPSSMPPHVPPHGHPAMDPAIANALGARARRQEARQIVQNDPGLARDLGIGRPDRPRQYLDGGLVDLNNAPAEAVAGVAGIDPATAQRVVEARQQWAGGFSSLDEVVAYVELTEQEEAQVRDRGVVLPR